MSCNSCGENGYSGRFLDHHESGCRRCDCKTSRQSFIGADDKNSVDRNAILASLSDLGFNKNELLDAGKGTVGAVYLIVGLMIALSLGGGAYLLLTTSQPTPPQYLQGYYERIANPVNATQQLRLTVNLNSTTFGAQSPITILAKVEPTQKDRDYNFFNGVELPISYNLWFDGTFCRLSDDRFERIYACWFELKRTPEVNATWLNTSWRGSENLVYTYGSDFDVAIGNGLTDELDRIKVGKPFIHIEGVEATNSYNSARVSNFLSQTNAAIAMLALIATVASIYGAGLKHLASKGYFVKKKTAEDNY